MNSIRTIQVDYDEIIKFKQKTLNKANEYSYDTVMINKDNKTIFYQCIEDYSTDGKLISKQERNPKDKNLWFNWSEDTYEILKRVP